MQTAQNVKRSLTNVRPSAEAVERIELYRESAKVLVDIIFKAIPECRERSLAITHLEETVMWGVKAICLTDPEAREIPIGEA
jgi:hypothetical protein